MFKPVESNKNDTFCTASNIIFNITNKEKYDLQQHIHSANHQKRLMRYHHHQI